MITFIEEPVFEPSSHFPINSILKNGTTATYPIYNVASALYFKTSKRLFLFHQNYNFLNAEQSMLINQIPSVKYIDNSLTFNFIQYYDPYKFNRVGFDKRENCNIFEYEIVGECPDRLDLYINSKEIILTAIDTLIPTNIDLLQTTLFKNDFKNIRNHVDYYSKYHGIKHFLLYYNGLLGPTMRSSLVKLLDGVDDSVNIYLLSVNYDYWYFLRTSYINHNAQNIQLTHASIIANYCSDWLLNVDFDEFVYKDTVLSDLIKNTQYDGIIIQTLNHSCKGLLCHKDYNFTYEHIYTTPLFTKDSSNTKYAERTRNKKRFMRNIHKSTYANKYNSLNINAYHIQCLSPNIYKTRYCVPK